MNDSRHRAAPSLSKIAAATMGLALAGWPGTSIANEVSGFLAKLAGETLISREISLKDLGLREPIVLNSADARRELFLPVPPGVALVDAALQFDARYLRGEGGRTNFVLSFDGYSVSSRSFVQPEGDAGLKIGVDGTPRSNGFVRVGAAWTSIVSERACGSERTSGNILEISPTTRLSYRYNGADIKDLASAWMALPSSVTLAIAGKSATQESYDAAWRIGVALRRSGKKVSVRSLPSLGDEVDLAGFAIPEALRRIPAFGKLAGAGRLKIEDPAELGAFLMLQAFQPDVAIVDQDFQAMLDTALSALEQQIGASSPEAREAFTRWRSQAMTLAGQKRSAGSIELVRLAGRPVIAVAPDAGAKAAGLFSDLWKRVAVSEAVVVAKAEQAADTASNISLTRLGGTALSFDVLERGDWSATFNLGDVSFDGRVPSGLELDVSASPGATTTLPVASVFINDMLLGAKRLDANGRPERIAVDVPAYALKPQNALRVSFQRQAAGEHCRETPQAYPVAILPTSRLLLEKAPLVDDFTGVTPRLAGSAAMIVSPSWLADAPTTLENAIALADATGISPVRASFAVGAPSTKPSGPFLALDVPVDGAAEKVKVDGGRLIIAGQDSTHLLDVAGIDGLGVIGVVKSGDIAGLAYRTIGTRPLQTGAAISLTGGDVAVIGSKGVLAQLDTRDPFGTRPAADDRKTWTQDLWSQVAWGGSAGGLAFFALLLLRARHVRRRHSGDDHA